MRRAILATSVLTAIASAPLGRRALRAGTRIARPHRKVGDAPDLDVTAAGATPARGHGCHAGAGGPWVVAPLALALRRRRR